MESNGPDGASEDVVEVPVVDRHADADLLREEGDGASTSSSVASGKLNSLDIIFKIVLNKCTVSVLNKESRPIAKFKVFSAFIII